MILYKNESMIQWSNEDDAMWWWLDDFRLSIDQLVKFFNWTCIKLKVHNSNE